MVRAVERFVCQSCGATHGKWSGRCSACGDWNSITAEATPPIPPKGLGVGNGRLLDFRKLNQHMENEGSRTASGLGEFDRVCGGGLVPGSTILIGGDPGIGQPPVIRNYRDLNAETGSHILGSRDGAPTYLMLYNGAMAPGAVSHPVGGGHVHPWEHVVFILEGHASIMCEGTDYPVAAGDGILVPPNTFHQWRNTSDQPMTRVTFNPLESETAEH